MLRGISIALAAMALAAPAAAETPHVTMGMGEQNPGMFDDARFLDTGIRHARLILPYDVVKAGGWQLCVGRRLACRGPPRGNRAARDVHVAVG